MRRNANWLLGALLACASLSAAAAASAQVTLEVMNPRGEIPPPKTVGISPRGRSLDGKKIVLIDNGKYGASNFLDALAGMLKQKYPTATVVMYPKPAAQTITDSPEVVSNCEAAGRSFRLRCR